MTSSQHKIPDSFVKVSLLPSGFLTLPEHFFCADQHDKSVRNTVPSMSFLLRHPQTGTNVVFDLGMRRKLDDYPRNIHAHLRTRQPIHTAPDVAESLKNGGLEPSNVHMVILSHVHYDHVGDPRDFTGATFIVGYGTRNLLENGMNYHSAAHFEKDLLPAERTVELPIQAKLPNYQAKVVPQAALSLSPPTTISLDRLVPETPPHRWKPLPPFDNAIDLFGDRLIYIVDSPGHLVGHLNVLARVSCDKWVYLAGDACHHSRILDGSTEMATWEENGMSVCIHADKSLADDTLTKIRRLRKEGFCGASVEVVLAHDGEWYKEHQQNIFPAHL